MEFQPMLFIQILGPLAMHPHKIFWDDAMKGKLTLFIL
jgi:hypothetical protein